MFRKWILMGFLLMSQPLLADQSRVYLLSSFTYKGTPITKAVILEDKRITSLEQCQDFVRFQIRGNERGKNYYRHYVKIERQGVNIVSRYTCIETTLNISQWNDHDFYKWIYLIDLRKGYKFTAFEDTNSCWASIRKDPDKHSRKLFCAKMSQKVI